MKVIRSQLLFKCFFILFCGLLTAPLFRKSFYYISLPFFYLQNHCFYAADGLFDFITSKNNLIEKIKILEAENKYILNGSQNIVTQNINLDEHIKAKIVYRDFKNNHFVKVNKGFSDNVSENMIAIVDGKFFGKVVEVYRWHSKIMLISDLTMAIIAETGNAKHEGVVQGSGNLLRAQFNFVNHLLPISINEPVFSTGEGLSYPKRLLIGFIKGFKKDGVNYLIELKLALDPFSVKECILVGE